MIAPGVEITSRRAANDAPRAEALSEIGAQNAGRDRPVLQRGGVVVEPDEFWESRASLAHQGADRLGPIGGEIDRDAARRDGVHHQPMPEGGFSRAQGPLAQHAAMGVHQRKGGVVANGADVAEMIGEALELRHQAAKPVGAGRRLGPERGLDRAREGDAVGDRRIAAHSRSQDSGALDACAARQAVDPFVDIAETLLEPHHGFAACVEAEVARLDDACVDRTDRNLVQSCALRAKEGVGVRRAVVRVGPPKRMTYGPSAVIEPASRVSSIGRGKPEEIAGRAFKSTRRSMDRRHGRKRSVVTGEIENLERLADLGQRHAHSALVPP